MFGRNSLNLGRQIVMLGAIAMITLGASKAWADPPIVGFWQVTWTDANSGAVVLNLWDAWHSDGTESQNDTGPILSGFVCQGAWSMLGKHTFGLIHPAFNYLVSPEGSEGVVDTTSSTLILEKVTVSGDRQTLTGTGIIKTIAGTNPLDPTAAVLAAENINISGKRINVDPSQLP